MMKIQLSKRMDRLAGLVTAGNRLADVGTDHGYIPIALMQSGEIPSAIAMDINQGPLDRARDHIREQHLDTYITTRLSDGLTFLQDGEADTVLIAGMGGALTVHILEGGAHCLASVKELILQPQSEIWLVREWLCEHGYKITDEDIVLDEGKYYPMMRAVHGSMELPSRGEREYGNPALQRSIGVWSAYLRAEQGKTDAILKTLVDNGQKDSDRYVELLDKRSRMVDMLGKIPAGCGQEMEEHEMQ